MRCAACGDESVEMRSNGLIWNVLKVIESGRYRESISAGHRTSTITLV